MTYSTPFSFKIPLTISKNRPKKKNKLISEQTTQSLAKKINKTLKNRVKEPTKKGVADKIK